LDSLTPCRLAGGLFLDLAFGLLGAVIGFRLTQATPGVRDIVATDADPTNGGGNTAFAIGPIDECISVSAGDSIWKRLSTGKPISSKSGSSGIKRGLPR
jgi:hypothetical protein